MDNTITADGNVILSDEHMRELKKAIKIGFYRSFYNSGIINAKQFERLLQMQNEDINQ